MYKDISQVWRQHFITLIQKNREQTLLKRSIQVLSVVFVAVILILRGGDRFWHPQFWAEDGPIFFQGAYDLSFWQSVFKPHFNATIGTGYFVVLNRILAAVALLFDLNYVPTIFMLSAFVVAVITCSLFILDNFSWFIPSTTTRMLFCFLLAALPASYEILLRFLNLQWYLGILTLLLVLMDPPQGKVSRTVYVFAWFVLALSNPQTILFLPCLIIRALIVDRRRKTVWMGCCVILIGFIPTIWFNITTSAPHSPFPSITDISLVLINGVAMRVLVAATIGAARSYSWFFQTDLLYGYLWYVPYILFTVAILTIFIRKRSYAALIIWAYTAYCIVMPILLGAIRNVELIVAARNINTLWGGERYFVLPLAAFYLFFFWWLSTLARTRVLTYIAWFLLLLCITSAVTSDFHDPANYNDQQWAFQVQRIKYAEGLPFASTVDVPVSPGGPWHAQLQIKPLSQKIAAHITFADTIARGSFDTAVSDQTMTKIISETGQIAASGWATSMIGDGPADGVLIVDAASQDILAYTMNHSSRQDIVVATKNPHFLWTGWQISFPAAELSVGSHTLQAYVVDTASRQAFPLANTQSIQIVPDVRGIIETAQGAKSVELQPILPEQPVRQEFIATQPNLSAVALTPATLNKKVSGPVTFYLQQLNGSSNNPYIATITIDAATFAKKGEFWFQFPPQVNSAGKRYAIMIAAPEATPDNAITLWMQSGDPYPAGQLTQGNKSLQGDLSFQLLYQ